MREPLKDRERLQHILDAIDTLQERASGLSYEELTADKLRYAGVVWYTMVIGEAAYKLSNAFVTHFPQVEWNVIANMRHHLVHGYYQVSEEDVWDVIQNDLAPLRQQVAYLLETIDWDEWSKVENGNIGITGN